jgi:hypothetical protein
VTPQEGVETIVAGENPTTSFQQNKQLIYRQKIACATKTKSATNVALLPGRNCSVIEKRMKPDLILTGENILR